jgi:hypothetical protein
MTVFAGDPVYAADVNAIYNASLAKPLVRLIASGAQSITNNTNTAIIYSGVDDIDTDSFHDPATNNTRITPTKAGYYKASVTYWTASSVPLSFIETFVRKNGATSLGPVGRLAGLAGGASNTGPAIGTAQTFSVAMECIVSLDGVTDYVEHMVRQAQSSGTLAVNTNVTGVAFSCHFQLEYLRGL